MAYDGGMRLSLDLAAKSLLKCKPLCCGIGCGGNGVAKVVATLGFLLAIPRENESLD